MTKCNFCNEEAEISCYDCYKFLCKKHCIEYPVTHLDGNVRKDSSITICSECAEKRKKKKKQANQKEEGMYTCYLCGEEATAVCATCLQPICNIHRVSGYGKLSCIPCANKTDPKKIQNRNTIITAILLIGMILVMVNNDCFQFWLRRSLNWIIRILA